MKKSPRVPWMKASNRRLSRFRDLSTGDCNKTSEQRKNKRNILFSQGRTPLAGASNSDTTPKSQRFYRPVYF